MANDLVTRLMLNSTHFENNLGKSTKQVQEFQRTAQKVSKGVESAFTTMTSVVGKMIPAIGGVMGAFEAFNKTIQSTQSLTDEFGRITEQTTSIVDSFFNSLAKGDFSNFINGLQDVIRNAREAYNAIDDLGTFNIFKSPQIAKIEAEISKYKYNIKAGIDVEVNKKKLKEAENELQVVTKQSIEKNQSAFYTSMRKYLGEQGGKFTNQQIDKVFESYSSYNEYEKKYGEYQKKVAELNKIIRKNTEVTSEGDLIYNKTAEKTKKQLTELQAKNKNLIALHEIGDDKLKDAFRYRTQMYNEESKFYSTATSNLKAFNKQVTSTGKVTKQVAQEIQRLTNDKFDFSVGEIKLFNSSTNSFDGLSNEIVAELRKLPVGIKDELEKEFTKLVSEQKQLQQSFNDGLINEETFSKEGNKLSEDVLSTISKFINGQFINFNVTAEDQSKVTSIVQKLYETLKDNVLGNRQNSAIKNEADSLFGKSNELFTGSVKLNNIFVEANSISDFESAKKGADELRQAIVSLEKEYTELKEMDGISDSMVNYINNAVKGLESLLEQVDNIGNKADEMISRFKEIENVRDSLDSTAYMISSIGNVFREAGEEETAFFIQSMAQISQLIAELANMAIVAGVSSAAKLPFPYNLGAIATTVATISSIVVGAMQTFANGGIVDGNSYVGDRKTVRVNSGEMILNKKQQANLFNIINEGRIEAPSTSGNVTFRIQGKELVGVLNNYNNKRGKLI